MFRLEIVQDFTFSYGAQHCLACQVLTFVNFLFYKYQNFWENKRFSVAEEMSYLFLCCLPSGTQFFLKRCSVPELQFLVLNLRVDPPRWNLLIDQPIVVSKMKLVFCKWWKLSATVWFWVKSSWAWLDGSVEPHCARSPVIKQRQFMFIFKIQKKVCFHLETHLSLCKTWHPERIQAHRIQRCIVYFYFYVIK